MDAMTDSELEEIEKACAEATPGPWTEAKGRIVAQPDPPNGPWERICTAAMPWSADAYLIANARSWVPALVAEVKRLRRALDPTQYGLTPDRSLTLREAIAKCAAAVSAEREACLQAAVSLCPNADAPTCTCRASCVAALIRARGKP